MWYSWIRFDEEGSLFMNTRLVAATMCFIIFSVAGGEVHSGDISLDRLFDPALVGNAGDQGLYSGELGNFSQEPEFDFRDRGDFGWYVGTAIVTLRMNMRVFDPMSADRRLDSFTDRVVLGGPMGGLIYKDLRVGVMLLSGYQHQNAIKDNYRRNAFINFTGFSGFIEYSHMIERRYPRRVPYLRVGYLVGVNVGTGQLTLHASGLDLDRKGSGTSKPPSPSPTPTWGCGSRPLTGYGSRSRPDG
jgi:hypothetical protein